MPIRTLSSLLESRPWLVLSIACALFALYEAVTKLIAGDEIEGVLDLVVTAVIAVNAVNRVKIIAQYFDKLRG